MLFILWALPSGARAQNPFPGARLQEAYEKILQLKFKEGRSVLASLRSPDPHPVYYYVHNLADMLELLVTEDPRLFEQLSGNEAARETALAQLPDNDPYKLFCLAEIKMQWAFVKLKYGQELNAAWDLRKAYKMVEENHRRFPEFLPDNKSRGALHIIFGAVPDNYHWVLGLLGIHGSVTSGVRELESVKDTWLGTEAVVINSLAHAYILQEVSTSLAMLRPLYRSAPDNQLYKYLYALLLIKGSESESAWKVLNEAAQAGEGYPRLPLLDYFRGEVMLQKGHYTRASTYFTRFLTYCKGRNFIKDANFKLFLCYWLSGNDTIALQYFEKARSAGTTLTAADKYADRLLGANERPHKLLMKVRLHTDGGYYQAAEALLETADEDAFDKRKDRVEFYYRKARLLHKQKQFTPAIPLYKKTIKASGDSRWYFAPNAALQLGNIYLDAGQAEAARFYFEKALSYKGHPYKSSIDQKAKYGLERVENLSPPLK